MPMVATSPSMRSHSWSEVNSVIMTNPLAFASSTFVSVGDEGHRRDLQRQPLAAQFGKHPAANRGLRRRQIAHRHWHVEARTKATGGDPPDPFGGSPVRE